MELASYKMSYVNLLLWHCSAFKDKTPLHNIHRTLLSGIKCASPQINPIYASWTITTKCLRYTLRYWYTKKVKQNITFHKRNVKLCIRIRTKEGLLTEKRIMSALHKSVWENKTELNDAKSTGYTENICSITRHIQNYQNLIIQKIRKKEFPYYILQYHKPFQNNLF